MKSHNYTLQFSNETPKFATVRSNTFENTVVNQTAAVITEQPIDPNEGTFYFEIEYERGARQLDLCIGLQQATSPNLYRHVGEITGLGFRSNATLLDGTGLMGQEFAAGKRFGEPIAPRDAAIGTAAAATSKEHIIKERLGLGIDTIKGNVFLAINGEFVGVGFRAIFNALISPLQPIYPAVSLKGQGQIRFYFNKEDWKFKSFAKTTPDEPTISTSVTQDVADIVAEHLLYKGFSRIYEAFHINSDTFIDNHDALKSPRIEVLKKETSTSITTPTHLKLLGAVENRHRVPERSTTTDAPHIKSQEAKKSRYSMLLPNTTTMAAYIDNVLHTSAHRESEEQSPTSKKRYVDAANAQPHNNHSIQHKLLSQKLDGKGHSNEQTCADIMLETMRFRSNLRELILQGKWNKARELLNMHATETLWFVHTRSQLHYDANTHAGTSTSTTTAAAVDLVEKKYLVFTSLWVEFLCHELLEAHLTAASTGRSAIAIAADYIMPLIMCGRPCTDEDGNDMLRLEITPESSQLLTAWVDAIIGVTPAEVDQTPTSANKRQRIESDGVPSGASANTRKHITGLDVIATQTLPIMPSHNSHSGRLIEQLQRALGVLAQFSPGENSTAEALRALPLARVGLVDVVNSRIIDACSPRPKPSSALEQMYTQLKATHEQTLAMVEPQSHSNIHRDNITNTTNTNATSIYGQKGLAAVEAKAARLSQLLYKQ